MPAKTAYELGARKLEALEGPDPSDEFSQDAAKNRKPPQGIGLTEPEGDGRPARQPRGKPRPRGKG